MKALQTIQAVALSCLLSIEQQAVAVKKATSLIHRFRCILIR